MLNIGGLKDICRNTGVAESDVLSVLETLDEQPDHLVEQLELHYPDPGKSPRRVICIRGKFRILQERLYKKILLRKLNARDCSHGGVRGRGTLSNARAHFGNRFGFVTDISRFYPSISEQMVFKFFSTHGCAHEGARLLTRLCTYQYHLALGLITSPIIANALFADLDARILKACECRKLVYTRYVDDITISGRYELSKCGIIDAVTDILKSRGFWTSKEKTDDGKLDELEITGIRVKQNRIDVAKLYVQELERSILDHIQLSEDREFTGPLMTEAMLFGRVLYVGAVNPGRLPRLKSLLRKINWIQTMGNAAARKLVIHEKRLVKVGSEVPDCARPVGIPYRKASSLLNGAGQFADSRIAPF